MALSDHRVEEEMRKRLFHHDAFDGPFEIRGQQMRLVVGNHAMHQTHSMAGSGCIGHQSGQSNEPDMRARCLGGCDIVQLLGGGPLRPASFYKAN